jgi:lipid-A-disaccharide synthase
VTLRIGVVVGEISGDNLAVNLIRSFRQHYPDVVFEGILGPALIKEGGNSFYPMERLAVMGLIEPLARIPELYKIRRHLIQYFTDNPPDVFIGVDAPDFNLSLEKILRARNILTVHYVSPSVWAWRQWRIKKIKKAVDLMLALFPFESTFYEKHSIPVCYTGHPLADQIPLDIDTESAKKSLGLDPHKKVITIMPGSRNHEIKYLAETFIKTAFLCFKQNPAIEFMVPLISIAHKNRFEALVSEFAPEIPFKVLVGQTRLAISAADVVLVASGTATLEVMLHKKPMVVAYRLHTLTYHIAKHLVKIPYVSLPNLLAEEMLVPEFIQDRAQPELLSAAILDMLSPTFDRQKLVNRFTALHQLLKQDGSDIAANAILKLID